MSTTLEINPRVRARETLLQLFNMMSAAGGPPSQDEFFPVRLDRIVREVLGWKLEHVAGLGFADFGRKAIRGKCIFDEKLIRIDSGASEGVKRFSLAHEIGHAVLHRAIIGSSCGAPLLNRSVQKGNVKDLQTHVPGVELEAEAFAAELLMPERAVRKQFERMFGAKSLWSGEKGPRQQDLKDFSERLVVQKPDNGFRSLTEFFGVSQSAMARRLRELGLVYD